MTKTKKLIYHFRVRGTGAEGVHIAGIVNGFRSLGQSVRLVSPTGIDPTVQKQLTKEKTLSKPSFVTSILHKMADILPQPFFEVMELIYNIFAIPKLWIAARKERPDFIYERYAFFNFSGAILAHFMRIPLVVEVNEISGHKRVRGQCFVRLAQFVERYIFHLATLVITVSDFLNHEVANMTGVNSRIVTIPNGVPQAWLKMRPSGEVIDDLRNRLNLNGKKVIFFIGGLVLWHNFDMLLDVISSLQEDVPETVLLIVGEGPMRSHIQQMTSQMDLKKNSVLLTGNISHSDVPLYISLADAAIIPETNSFRSPIKMFEYMAMARPVVAPRMAAIQAVIDDGWEGLLFEPGDKVSCHDALLKLITDPEFAHTMGQRAYEKIAAQYTWEMHAQMILELV